MTIWGIDGRKSEKVFVFDTLPGRRYVLCDNTEVFGTDEAEIYVNSRPKKIGEMTLGTECEY